jgi:RNA polymerase sigma-70 factor (ECF subfamily)
MPVADDSWESTLSLLARARAGDEQATNDLFARYGPAIRRWASGRLPRWARDLAETSDLVQDTLLRTFKRLGDFDHRGEGAFFAYLRQALMNRVRDELRRVERLPGPAPLDDQLADPGHSPLVEAIGAEALDRYDRALDRLSEDERELITARVELSLTYAEIAAACGKPSPDAARMAVGRALVRLAEEMSGSPRPAR